MKKALAAVIVFVILCLCLAYDTLDELNNTINARMIAFLSEKTGRAVTINGETKTSYSLNPSVRISDIKLANPQWTSNPDMLQIGTLEMQVDFFALFRREIVLKEINLKNVSLDFEKGRDNAKSWSLMPEKGEKKCAEETKCIEKKEKSLRVTAENLTAENFQIVYQDLSDGAFYQTHVDAAELKRNLTGYELASKWENDGRVYDINLKTTSGDKMDVYNFLLDVSSESLSVRAQGSVSGLSAGTKVDSTMRLHTDQASVLNKIFTLTLPDLSDVNATIRFNYDLSEFSVRDFNIRAGTEETALISADGKIFSRFPLSFRVHTEINALNMGAVNGLPDMPALNASADIEQGSGFSLRNLKISAGDSDLSGFLEFANEPDFFISGRFESQKFSMPDFVGRFFIPSLKKKRPDASNIFSAGPLPFEKLKKAKIDVNVSLADVTAMDGSDLGSFDFGVKMKDGIFDLTGFELAEYASVHGRFDASGQPAKLNMNIKMKDLPLPLFLHHENVKSGKMNASINLTGQGYSEVEIASSVTGHLFAEANEVNVSSIKFSSFPEKFSSVLKANSNIPLLISCSIVNIPVKNGYFSLQNAIGMESDIVDFLSKGDMDLSKERIRLEFKTDIKIKKIFSKLFEYISVRGSLRNPDVEIEINKTIAELAERAWIYLTGGKNALEGPALKNVCKTVRSKEQKVYTGE